MCTYISVPKKVTMHIDIAPHAHTLEAGCVCVGCLGGWLCADVGIGRYPRNPAPNPTQFVKACKTHSESLAPARPSLANTSSPSETPFNLPTHTLLARATLANCYTPCVCVCVCDARSVGTAATATHLQ